MILNHSSPIDVGAVCLGYGRGGYETAGMCQVANNRADAMRAELVRVLSREKALAAA